MDREKRAEARHGGGGTENRSVVGVYGWLKKTEKQREREGEKGGRGRGGEIEEQGGDGDGIGRKQQFPFSGPAGCYHEKQASTLIF